VETIRQPGAYQERGEVKDEAAMGAMMKAIGALAVAAAMWVAAASAEELTADRSRAIVERQFEAFARDDAEAAYALADPTIKQMFGDAGHFMAMVRDRYAPVYRHRSVEFGAFAASGDEASLQATLVDNDNVVWTAFYGLRREANGDWLISGCILLKSEGSAI
ncbi:MAG: DUF4864 domain-containing protein, partial [Candidatus Acidiferrum sp.]